MPSSAQIAHAQKMMNSRGGTAGMGKLMKSKKMKKLMKNAMEGSMGAGGVDTSEMMDLMDTASKSGILENKRLKSKIEKLGPNTKPEDISRMTNDILSDGQLMSEIVDNSQDIISKLVSGEGTFKRLIDSAMQTTMSEILDENGELDAELKDVVKDFEGAATGDVSFVDRVKSGLLSQIQSSKTVLVLSGVSEQGKKTVTEFTRLWASKTLGNAASLLSGSPNPVHTFVDFAKGFEISEADAVLLPVDAMGSVTVDNPVIQAMGGHFVHEAMNQTFESAGGKRTKSGSVVTRVGTCVTVGSPNETLACRRLLCCVARSKGGAELDVGAVQVAVGLARQCGWKRIIYCVDQESADTLIQAVEGVQCETLKFSTSDLPPFCAKKE